MKARIKNTKESKICMSEKYNYIFRKSDGLFVRWGETREVDPLMAPAPEIADIEVTTKCSGINGKPCPWCYKSNTENGTNMSFETFKNIIDKFPPLTVQIAFGVDSKAESNPDLWKMMEYTRSRGIIPNITVADITNETADKLAKYCGAVAVSRYNDKNICYDSIKKLLDRDINQVNIHQLICSETYENALETIEDIVHDSRLKHMYSLVFLSLKQTGRGKHFTPLSKEKFKTLVEKSIDSDISFGFDSCSAAKFLSVVKNNPNFRSYEQCSEPCESSLFSVYINSDGKAYPCSFSENTPGWEDGIDMTKIVDFEREVWYDQRMIRFRKSLLTTPRTNDLGCRTCPLFKV